MANRLLLTAYCSRFTVLVTGESMWPALIPGRRYTAQSGVEPQINDIVVAKHPHDPSSTIVKRVSEIQVSSEQQGVRSGSKPFTVHRSLFTLTGTVSWSSRFTVDRTAIVGVISL